MRKFIKSFGGLSLILFLPFLVSAQQTNVVIDRIIELDGNTSEQLIFLNVDEGARMLDVRIRSIIKKGQLQIDIIDPTGEKQGNLSVESQPDVNKTKQETVQGRINKTSQNPIPGKWVIKVRAIKAYGEVRLNSNIIYSDSK